jgi:Flp pilus assembly protein TadB
VRRKIEAEKQGKKRCFKVRRKIEVEKRGENDGGEKEIFFSLLLYLYLSPCFLTSVFPSLLLNLYLSMLMFLYACLTSRC